MANTLVLYFSVTNNTKKRAKSIAKKLNADLFEIKAKEPYTEADLDWQNPKSRESQEQHQDNVFVDIQDLPDVSHYQNIIIGHPTWSGIPPRLINTIIDRLDLNGKTLATFGTSVGSNYDDAQKIISQEVKKNDYKLTLIPGTMLNSEEAVDKWLNSFTQKAKKD